MYRKVYVSKEVPRQKPSIQMAVGTACHSAFDFAIRKKLEGKVAGVPEMLAIGSATLERESKLIESDIIDEIAGFDVRNSMSTARLGAAVAAFHRSILPNIAPLESEMRFELEWGDDKLTGCIDCVEVNSDWLLSVTDWKIGSTERTPDINSADASAQLPFYAMVYERLTGKRAQVGTLAHYVPSKRPHFTPRSVALTDGKYKAIELKVNRTIDAIKAGHFPPGDPYWSCNEKRCPLYGQCEMGAGK
jgi:hypothetical protein